MEKLKPNGGNMAKNLDNAFYYGFFIVFSCYNTK